MPLSVTCTCGASFRLKDEYAGKRLKCPKCAAVIQAPAAEPALVGVAVAGGVPIPAGGGSVGPLSYQAPAMGDGVFDRDKFLLRQKVMTLNQKYTVSDELKQPIAFVIRRSHIARSLLAALGVIVTLVIVGGVMAVGLVLLGDVISGGGRQPDWYIVLSSVLAIVVTLAACIAVGVWLSPKRHIEFYRNEAATDKLLEVLQDKKLQLIIATFTLRDVNGQTIALFRKNYLWNLIRRQWRIYAPDGTTVLARAMEDSIILSLLRRFIGGAIGAMLLRTNFIICRGESDEVIGEFNRKFTIVDRYVLDMSADPYRALDRRIALALGVLLDTGERR